MRYKNIVIAIVAFFILQSTKGQVNFKPGFRAGLGLSTIAETHSEYKSDFYIGGFGQINIKRFYTLQPEITYSRQGSNDVARNYSDNNSGIDKTEHRDINLDYLSFTLINKFTFGPGIQVQFGPALDVLIDDNLVKRKENNDLAFVTGVGFRMPSGLTFEARVKYGFYDVLDSDYYYNDSNDHYFFGDYNTNVTFQLGASYSFGGK